MMLHSLMPTPEIHELICYEILKTVIHVQIFIHNFDITAPCQQ